MRVDVFKQVDELIDSNYRIPLFDRACSIGTEPSTFVEVTQNYVELGVLLYTLKQSYIRLQYENDELRKDLRTVTHNGSVRWFADSYYSNGEAVDESIEIREKWFKKGGNNE